MEGVIFFGGDRDKTRALETKLEDTAVVYLKEIEKLKKQLTASKVTEMESYRTALHFHLKLWIHENNLELSDYSEDLVDDQKLCKDYRNQIYQTGMEDLNELDNYEPFFQYYKVKFQCFFLSFLYLCSHRNLGSCGKPFLKIFRAFDAEKIAF